MRKFLPAVIAATFMITALALVFFKDGNNGSEMPEKWRRWHKKHSEEKTGKQDQPDKAAEYWSTRLKTPNGENPAELNLAAMAYAKQNAKRGVNNLPNFYFQEKGPGNFGGRIRAVVINEADSDIILVGGVAGGVWKTTDGGETWNPSNDFMSNLAISCMFQDPEDPAVVYAGTGEGFFNVDSMRGLGIFVSNDFGDTWTQLASTNNSNFYYVNRIAIFPGTGRILAATRAGIFLSDDDGASWNEVSGQSINSRGFVDLKIDPSNFTNVFAYHYGSSDSSRRLFKSTNSGSTWTSLGSNEGLPTTDLSRMEIGIGNDGVVYVSVGTSAPLYQTRGLWRSSDGTNFTQTASATQFIERQAWYDLMVGVNPNDSDNVLLGAVDVYRTTNAGQTIEKITSWSPDPGAINQWVHADIHAIAFHPSDSNTFWIGCDGGLFKTTDGGNNFSHLNNNLRLTQYYGIDVHPDGQSAIGGTQDNGTHIYYGDDTTWLEWRGGDGGFCSWDQQQPNYVYGSTPAGGMFGSSQTGSASVGLTLPNTTGAAFIQPFTIDRNDGNRMIVGTDNIFFTNNLRQLASATWIEESTTLGTVSSTTISPINGLVAFAGTSSGSTFRSTNLGSGNSFSAMTLAGGGASTWFEVDPHDVTGDTVYATFGSYLPNRIMKTTDGGDSWTSISGDLPDIPLFCVVVDPTDPSRLFVGSELGVFTTGSNGVGRGTYTWDHYDFGPAWTRIVQMRWGDDNTLWIGTHGRSIYQAVRNPLSFSLEPIVDATCDMDIYIDLNETVTLPINVTNYGSQAVTNAGISLASSSGDLAITQNSFTLGTIGAGQTLTQDFELTLNNLPACQSAATLTVILNHDAATVMEEFAITLGANPIFIEGTYTEDAESDGLLTSQVNLGNTGWSRVSTQANNGTSSWFTTDEDNFAEKTLTSPWMAVQSGTTTLTFSLYYNMEGDASQYWDGVVLELRTEGGDWFDIGNLSTVPYDGQMFDNNPLYLRNAWSGNQSSWRNATVSLGLTYNGQNIQYRFRAGCDTQSVATNGGFWIDDIAITNVKVLSGTECDDASCAASCFATTADAVDAMLTSLGNNEWPGQNSVLDYVGMLNNICTAKTIMIRAAR